jgi:hypothetical protein
VSEWLKVERQTRCKRVAAIAFADMSADEANDVCIGELDFFWRFGEEGLLFAAGGAALAELDLRGMLQMRSWLPFCFYVTRSTAALVYKPECTNFRHEDKKCSPGPHFFTVLVYNL